MQKRTYRRPAHAELARIEERRIALSVSHEELYLAAGIRRSAYYDMRRTGLSFPARIKALRFGLRTIEQRMRAAARILEGADE
ncbi:MAG: hypothetical protein KUL88_04390 [Rhizobium sp.]|nr:hypothetical protein [Rhizobium sp.]